MERPDRGKKSKK